MKKLLIFILFCSFFSLSLYSFLSQNPAAIMAEGTLVTPQPITFYDTQGAEIPSYSQWIIQTLVDANAPGFDPQQVGEWAGSWGIKAKDDSIYLGIGVDRPMQTGGALFARATIKDNDPSILTLESVPVSNRLDDNDEALGYLEEDGMQEMAWLNDDRLLIAGNDPSYGDGWEGGNLYTYNISTDTLTKIRCLTGEQTLTCGGSNNVVFPNVVHFLGIGVLGDTVYLSGATPDSVNSDPILFKSTDAGQTWSESAVIEGIWYRGAAILPFMDEVDGQARENGLWFAIDGYGLWYRNAVFYNNEQQNSWEQITENEMELNNDSFHTAIRPVLFKGTPVYAEGHDDFDSLYQYKKNANDEYEIVEISLGSLKFGENIDGGGYFVRNDVLLATDEFVYIIADDNALYRSTLEDGATWQKVSEFGEDMILSMEYWSEENSIVAAEVGLDAQHFLVDLDQAQAYPSPSPTSDPTTEPSPTVIIEHGSSGTHSSKSVVINTAKPQKCEVTPPEATPDVIDIQRQGTTARVRFISSNNATGYYISYGKGTSIHQYGVSFDSNQPVGIVEYVVEQLDPAQTYSFSIRAQNQCQPGEWSPVVTVAP